MRVLVMGAYGFLGAVLCPVLSAAGHDVRRYGRGENATYQAEATQENEVELLLKQTRPEVVVNLVACTNVDECERETQIAYMANIKPVEILARVLENTSVHLLHISTDQVYDGSGPHLEREVSPCNVYALSKYAGEMAALTMGATILRTNFVGRSHVPGREAFTDWIVKSMRAQTAVTSFDDVLFSAVHVSDLSRYIEHFVRLSPSGVFNVGCSDGLSKASFALSLARLLELDPTCATVGHSRDVDLVARRPLDMRLAVEKFEQFLGVKAPNMAETLKLVAKDYEHDL